MCRPIAAGWPAPRGAPIPAAPALCKSFGGVKAAEDSTLSFADGSLTAVIGPNGAGKSTFFNLITGALKPDSGRILLNGLDMAGRAPPQRGRRGPGRGL